MYKIYCLNNISPEGLALLTDNYEVIENIDEVLDPANANVFFRNRLVLKPKTAEEKLLYTMDDE